MQFVITVYFFIFSAFTIPVLGWVLYMQLKYKHMRVMEPSLMWFYLFAIAGVLALISKFNMVH